MLSFVFATTIEGGGVVVVVVVVTGLVNCAIAGAMPLATLYILAICLSVTC